MTKRQVSRSRGTSLGVLEEAKGNKRLFELRRSEKVEQKWLGWGKKKI